MTAEGLVDEVEEDVKRCVTLPETNEYAPGNGWLEY